jgi:CheY-like chemotaxis protein
VDDERGIREMARIILKLQGYRVLAAENGVEALALFAAHVSDVRAVLTDIMMPQMDGISLIREVRKLDPAIVFIASTGRSDDKRMGEIEALDVPYTLMKPYSQEKLLATVRDALASAPRSADS